MKKILIIIDDIEFKYFEFNKLVTNFWLVYEYLRREYNVFITLKKYLFQKRNIPYGLCYETFIKDNNIFKQENSITKFHPIIIRNTYFIISSVEPIGWKSPKKIVKTAKTNRPVLTIGTIKDATIAPTNGLFLAINL